MGKVLVVQSKEGYSKEAYITKNAFLKYAEDVFGSEDCKLVFLPNECYDAVYDIYTGFVTFWWENGAESKLLETMDNSDVVIVTNGEFSWRKDSVVRMAVEHTKTIVLEYKEPERTLRTVYDPNDNNPWL